MDLQKLRNIGISRTSTRARPRSATASSTMPAAFTAWRSTASATMDYMDLERGVALPSLVRPLRWSGTTAINLIDTPGHVDFTVEVERSLACWTVRSSCFVRWVGCRPNRSHRSPDARHRVPRLAFINKLDRLADPYKVLQNLRKSWIATRCCCRSPSAWKPISRVS